MTGDEVLMRAATIRNQRGLHARAAAKFAKLAATFQAEVSVSRNGSSVSGVSIMGLMMLAAGIGTEVQLAASGIQAVEALDALVGLIDAKFDEED